MFDLNIHAAQLYIYPVGNLNIQYSNKCSCQSTVKPHPDSWALFPGNRYWENDIWCVKKTCQDWHNYNSDSVTPWLKRWCPLVTGVMVVCGWWWLHYKLICHRDIHCSATCHVCWSLEDCHLYTVSILGFENCQSFFSATAHVRCTSPARPTPRGRCRPA